MHGCQMHRITPAGHLSAGFFMLLGLGDLLFAWIVATAVRHNIFQVFKQLVYALEYALKGLSSLVATLSSNCLFSLLRLVFCCCEVGTLLRLPFTTSFPTLRQSQDKLANVTEKGLEAMLTLC